MNLQQLRALLEVAQSGSISAASRNLKMAQPALSRILKQLEQSVDAPLLHRNAHGAVLTEYGKALVSRARVIDAEIQKARDDIDQILNRRSGRIAIACSPVPLMFVLPMAMAMFRTQFPQVEVHVGEEVFPQVESALRESRFDFAVGPVPRPGPGPDFQVTKLFSVELVVVVRHDHPRARARSIADLMDDEWIVAGPPKGPGAIIESLFQRNHLSVPACPVHLESIFSAVETIKRTDLVGLLPLPLAQAASPSVRMLPIRERLDSLNVNIILPARSILTPAARALVSAIRISGGSWRQPAQSRSQAGPA